MATAIDIAASEMAPSPARKQQRKRVLMRGTVFTPDGAFVVWIRDISTQGALIAGDDVLPSNCDVIFKRGGLFAAAHIAWSNDTGAGVKFYRDLSDSEVAAADLPLPHRDD
ncbi:MAG: PilZ domain-containing protein [Sphingomicrobium sp.]